MDILISGKKQYSESEFNLLNDDEKQKLIAVKQYKSFNYIWIDGYDDNWQIRTVYREK